MESTGAEFRPFVAFHESKIKLQVLFRRQGRISQCETVTESNEWRERLVTVKFCQIRWSHRIGNARIQSQVVGRLNTARQIRRSQQPRRGVKSRVIVQIRSVLRRRCYQIG